MARGIGFCRGELRGLEVLSLVGREDLVGSCGAPLVLDSRVNSFMRTLFAKSRSVAEELGLEVRSKKSIRSRCMSSIAAMLLDTWARRVRADFSSPSRATEMASSSAALVTEAKNALATVIEYSWAFAEYFEAVRVLVMGSSMRK